MANQKLKFTAETNVFGTKILLSNRDKSFNQEIANGLDTNPLANMNTKLKDGYWFRSPNIANDAWTNMLSNLWQLSGEFNLWAVFADEAVTGYIKIADQSDAALFAWANVETWQKWSNAQEEEDIKNTKSAKKKPKIKVHKDGRITVKATVTTLGKA